MAYVEWSIRGPEINTCVCNWGCPCQFNALPSHGHCHAAIAVRIDEGRFGEVRLDGLKFVSLIAWPGAIHKGGGEALAVIDARADEPQRSALFTILKGEETEPGATIFNVFAGTIAKGHKPRFAPIEFEVDIAARTGRFAVPGLVHGSVEPIRNPVTGKPHRAQVRLPNGFEFRDAEFASGTAKTENAPFPLEWSGGHAHLATLHLTTHGAKG